MPLFKQLILSCSNELTELNLNNFLLNALDDMGYQHPTTIQHKAFAAAIQNAPLLF